MSRTWSAIVASAALVTVAGAITAALVIRADGGGADEARVRWYNVSVIEPPEEWDLRAYANPGPSITVEYVDEAELDAGRIVIDAVTGKVTSDTLSHRSARAAEVVASVKIHPADDIPLTWPYTDGGAPAWTLDPGPDTIPQLPGASSIGTKFMITECGWARDAKPDCAAEVFVFYNGRSRLSVDSEDGSVEEFQPTLEDEAAFLRLARVFEPAFDGRRIE
jgi:hypothetical protein